MAEGFGLLDYAADYVCLVLSAGIISEEFVGLFESESN